MKKVFVAGATGFVGRAIAAQPTFSDIELVLQVRPGSKQRHLLDDSRCQDVDIQDPIYLRSVVSQCDVIVQLIGTVRSRFGEAGNYEEVDYGTTQRLLVAASGQNISHFVLLSSVGAGMGVGSYLSWKKKTEELVRSSSIPYSILRPSYIAGDKKFPERKSLVNTRAFMNGLSDTPVGAGFATLKPMPVQMLARAILRLCSEEARQRVYLGNALFGLVDEGFQDTSDVA